MTHITLAISGASGAPYSLRLLEQLIKANVKVSLLISKAGYLILKDETDLVLSNHVLTLQENLSEKFNAKPNQLLVYGKDDWYSPLASGTGAPDAMVVCPCSVGCLAAIAQGMSDNLLERAADVVIKEQKKLILLVREMPLSVIHLEHMLKLAKMGVCIMPPNPGFYFKPEKLQEIIDFVVARILDNLNIKHQLSQRWGE